MRNKIERKLADFRSATAACKQLRLELKQADKNTETWENALTIIQTIGKTLQTQAHKDISEIVSKSLSAVFSDPYQFRIHFESKRNRTVANLQLFKNDLLLEDPIDETGGGIIDISAFVLRLTCLILQKPPLRRLVVLDEPFKFLNGRQYREAICQVLEDLAQEMDIQIIMATNEPEFVTGNVIEL